MRIAIVAPVWFRIEAAARGGIEVFLYVLAEELIRRGHDVTLFATGDSSTSARVTAICPINLVESMTRGEAYVYEPYANANLAEAFRRADSFDVIHSHLGCAWIPFGMLSKTPVLHSLHSSLTLDDVWVLMQYAEAPVTAVSRYQVAAVASKRLKGIQIIYNGCDFGKYEYSGASGKYLVFLGRMSAQKSPHEAIQVAHSVGLPIVLAGVPLDKSEEAYFSTKVQPLIDGKRATYIGPVNHAQKVELLKNASALLFPSQEGETFGIVMIEAMACGTPVVAYNKGAVREVVDYGVTGFYTDSLDEFPSTVMDALSLDRKGVRGQAMLRFSHSRMVDEYLDVYESLISGG